MSQLSEPEIWPMENILKLETMWPDPSGNRWRVGGILSEIQRQVLAFYPMYDYLIISLRENGQKVPIRISHDGLRLRDGIHRVAIAVSLGWNNMVVSRGSLSTWREWNESEDGQAYYTAWHRRLQGQGSVRVL